MNSNIDHFNAIEQASQYIRQKLNLAKGKNFSDLGIVLGSGLSEIADNVQQSENSVSISYSEIPNFPTCNVSGHGSSIIFGELSGRKIVVLSGRVHKYEGYSAAQVAFPIRVLASLGVTNVILTNSSGGLNPNMMPGDLMLIKDHINFTGDNPLLGPNNDKIGPRFPDMSVAYCPEQIRHVENKAKQLDIRIHQGVYFGVLGPCYETAAEIKLFRQLGADAIGMSTVFETIGAVHSGMKVCGLCCITNMAAGISKHKLSHKEVTDMAQKSAPNMVKLLKQSINSIV